MDIGGPPTGPRSTYRQADLAIEMLIDRTHQRRRTTRCTGPDYPSLVDLVVSRPGAGKPVMR